MHYPSIDSKQTTRPRLTPRLYGFGFANLFHLQEYPGAALVGTAIPIFGSGDPLWSLAVEWWIYMLFGVIAFRVVTLPALALALIASVSVMHNLVGGTGDRIAVVWLLGWLTFWAWKKGQGRIPSAAKPAALCGGTVLAVLALASVGFAPHRSHFGLDLPFALLTGSALLLFLLGSQVNSGPEARELLAGQHNATNTHLTHAIKGGAAYSFTLYLTHFSILTVLYDLRGALSPPLLVALAIVVSNGVAWLVARLGEQHTARLKQWMWRCWGLAHGNHQDD